jgi:hypothetical protein
VAEEEPDPDTASLCVAESEPDAVTETLCVGLVEATAEQVTVAEEDTEAGLVGSALPLLVAKPLGAALPVAVMLADALLVTVRVGVELHDTGVAVAVPLGVGVGEG